MLKTFKIERFQENENLIYLPVALIWRCRQKWLYLEQLVNPLLASTILTEEMLLELVQT